jgi:hypothetical protein
MVHNGNCAGAHRTKVTPMDLAQELHRLRESKVQLVSLAEKVGLAVPRSCCPHRGEFACLSCAADWLVAHLRLANGTVH